MGSYNAAEQYESDSDDNRGAIQERKFHKVQTLEQYRKGIDKPHITCDEVDRMRYEISQTPNAEREMQIDEDYYDGYQCTAEQIAVLDDMGMPHQVTNLIGPTVDLALGMEAKSRSDFVVKPQDDAKWEELCLALSQQIKEAEQHSKADEACSEAAKRQFKGGLGWVEVSRETNPFEYRYRVKHRDWREFRRDPFAQENNLKDARYLKRSKFFDRTMLQAMFTAKAERLESIGHSWFGPGGAVDQRDINEAPMMKNGLAPWRDYSWNEMEWMDTDRDRLLLDEVWYRVWVRGDVMELADGTCVPYNRANERHNLVLENGLAMLRNCAWPEMRVAFYVGPLRLQDSPSPYTHRDFPYVPFWGNREGRTGQPYGMVRRMRPMQDEVNARSWKMLWALSSRWVIADDDAVADHDEARMEVGRPDAYIRLNRKRKMDSKFDIKENAGIGEQQYKLMVDRIQRLQDVAGVYNTQLGKTDGGAESGVAIDQLIQQGATTLAPMFSNFRSGRNGVGDRLLSLIMEDMAKRRNLGIQVNSPKGKKMVVVNKEIEVQNPDGSTSLSIENDITKAKLRCTLEDVPATATFRQQQFMRISEMVATIGKVNPELASKLADLMVEAADVPNRQAFLDRIRELAGMAPDPETMTAEEKKAFEERAAKLAERQELEERAMAADVAGKEAKASKDVAQAEKVQADTEAVKTGIAKILEEVQLTRAQTELAGSKASLALAQIEAIMVDIQAQKAAMAAGAPGNVSKSESLWRF